MEDRENLSPHRRPSDLHQKSDITAKQGTEELKQEKWCEKLDRKTSVRGKTRLLRDVAGGKSWKMLTFQCHIMAKFGTSCYLMKATVAVLQVWVRFAAGWARSRDLRGFKPPHQNSVEYRKGPHINVPMGHRDEPVLQTATYRGGHPPGPAMLLV